MQPESILYAGAELSPGRRPVTFAGLDQELNIRVLEKFEMGEVLACLQRYERSLLAIDVPTAESARKVHAEIKRRLSQAGLRPFLRRDEEKQWLETDAQDCFRAWGSHRLLPRRALEGRLQRSAILYERGIRIDDPVDLFEEITRFKLVQGDLPLANLPGYQALDALAAAYVSWLALNRPQQVILKGDFMLPAPE